MKRPATRPLVFAALRACVMLSFLATVAHAQNQPAPAPVAPTESAVKYATLNGSDLTLDIYTPANSPNPHPAVLRLSSHKETLSPAGQELLAAGYTLIYARYLPDSAGPVSPTSRVFNRFPADLHVAKAAIRFARGNAAKYNIDASRIALWAAGHAASIAALAAVTPDNVTLNGALGDFPRESSAIRALCLFEGTTDWRNAELYGDELVNIPNSPAYQLFGGNPKEHPDEARQASAVNYIRPTSPATLMVTLASDEQRAMHMIFAETLRKAGVASALYEEPLSAAGAGRVIDETRLNRTVVEFFKDTLAEGKPAPKSLTLDQEIDQLAAGGLFKQARRLIEEQLTRATAATPNDAASLPQRAPWLTKLRQINDLQQQPALAQLTEAKRAGKAPAAGGAVLTRTIWTIREVLTDPERIGQYTVEAAVPQYVFESRADALKYVETLNNYFITGDFAKADSQAALLREIARRGDADPAILNDFLTRYDAIRSRPPHAWPPGVKSVPFASDFGQDLYGYWLTFKAGGTTQRLRFVPPGRFAMGSAKDEWGRLPGEPILEQTEIPKGFWIGESEVTQALWEGVMGREENRSAFKSSAEVRLNLPAENVSYAHAVNFLNKLGIDARLPTEAEWEYACRAGSPFMYSGTGRLADIGWFWDEARPNNANPAAPTLDANGEVDVRILHELETDRTDTARLTHPVKQKLPNRWGIYDMQGNVWEWCAGTSPDKPRNYHPVKGGSWLSIPQSCRAARDTWLPIEQQSWNLGVRICVTAQ